MAGTKIKIKSLDEIEQENYFEHQTTTETGILPLDIILSGGIISSDLIQLVGESGTGKTSLSLQISLNYCKDKKNVLYIDTKADITEFTLKNYGLMDYLGKGFYYAVCSSFKKVDEKLNQYINTGELDLIIIDSIPSLVNDGYLNISEDKGIKIDNNNTNYDTRPLLLLLRKLSKLSIENNFAILLVNEFRNKVDPKLGTFVKIFGPKALQYDSNVILKLYQGKDKEFISKFNALKKENIGTPMYLETIKSNRQKVGSGLPFFLDNGSGYSEIASYIYALLKMGAIKQRGTYYEFGNETFKGFPELYKYCKEEVGLDKFKGLKTKIEQTYKDYISDNMLGKVE